MVTIWAGGEEKPEREEVVEPLEEPTPDRRKEPREQEVPEVKPEEIPAKEAAPAAWGPACATLAPIGVREPRAAPPCRLSNYCSEGQY